MIHLLLLGGVLSFVVGYGFRDWFYSLCALIVLTAVADHQYFKENLLDIPGFKPWNALLVVVVAQWAVQRQIEKRRYGTPRWLVLAFGAFVVAVMWGAVIAIFDLDYLLSHTRLTMTAFVLEEFVNPLKLFVPAMLVFGGCNSRGRMTTALVMSALIAVVFALMIFKYIPPSSLLDPDSVLLYRLRIDKEIGVHPNNIVNALVPGFWMMLFLRMLTRRRLLRIVLIGLAGLIGVAILLTQSRTGMVALVGVALGLGVLRYRKLGLITLVLTIGAVFTLPSLTANWSRGFSEESPGGGEGADVNEVTNGRYVLWQQAFVDIGRSPLMGNGRWYAKRYQDVSYSVDGHPHNAYLEIWVENGIFALITVVSFFVMLLWISVRLLRRGREPLEVVIGACATACLLTHFVIGIGGRAFTPRISSEITYCVCALALRVYLNGRRDRLSANRQKWRFEALPPAMNDGPIEMNADAAPGIRT